MRFLSPSKSRLVCMKVTLEQACMLSHHEGVTFDDEIVRIICKNNIQFENDNFSLQIFSLNYTYTIAAVIFSENDPTKEAVILDYLYLELFNSYVLEEINSLYSVTEMFESIQYFSLIISDILDKVMTSECKKVFCEYANIHLIKSAEAVNYFENIAISFTSNLFKSSDKSLIEDLYSAFCNMSSKIYFYSASYSIDDYKLPSLTYKKGPEYVPAP